MTIDEIWDRYEAGSPRYLFEDALNYLADDLRDAEQCFLETARDYATEAARFEKLLEDSKRSKFKIVGGEA
ncbi:hypothetical protein [Rhizobium sp. Root708]|uniref:hypothetical protein n=1 Tax=Rhizobium sp. Root708 TaxID=1736592 RepID=UPI0012E3EF8B|nr:hypothetical protein [Rhizobium sp. Root708]